VIITVIIVSTPWVALESKFNVTQHVCLFEKDCLSQIRDERSDSKNTLNALFHGHYVNDMSDKIPNITNNTNDIVVLISNDELVIEESTTLSDVGVVSDGLRDGT